MKKSKDLVKTQRKSLDEKLKVFHAAKHLIRPKAGWVKAIREAIGMTSSQLAERMGIQQSGVTLLEQREVQKKVTLETLQRAAEAMNCEVVYAIVPRDSLEKIVDEQSVRSARLSLRRIVHSMKLERQESGPAETALHEEELAAEIKNKLDHRLWGTK